METNWKLEELAKRAGVSARTVRYYVQRGLVPAPLFRGRDTSYHEEHLLRLKAIRKLQERFLPLDAIEDELKRHTPEEIRKLVEGVEEPVGRARPAAIRPAAHPLPVGETWTRLVLGPGLELHLSNRADAMTRSLVEELRALVERSKTGGEK